MNPTKLEVSQIIRKGKFPAPNVPGYNSLFFHELTQGNDTRTLYAWGNELTKICELENLPYYYFNNDNGVKINVYPNDLIESWWHSR